MMAAVAVAALFWASVASSHATVVEGEFTRRWLCSVQTFIDDGCMQPIMARGKVDCARICNEDATCKGISIDNTEMCYIHRQCGMDDPALCTEDNHDPAYTLYEKVASPVQVLFHCTSVISTRITCRVTATLLCVGEG